LPDVVPNLSAVIGDSPVGMDERVAAPESATPEEQSVLMGRIFDSRISQALMKAPEAEKRIFEDLSYSTPTTGPGWADKLMEMKERFIIRLNGNIHLLTNEVWLQSEDPTLCKFCRLRQ
jgi:hypothetical protein